MGYQVFLNNNTVLSESASFNSFKLGETVWSMLQDSRNEIIVFVKVEDIGVIPILTVCLKEKLKFSPFVISGKEMLWDVSKSFVGDSTPKFRISFCENDTVKHSFDISEVIDKNYKSRYFSLAELEIGIYDVTVDLMKRVGFIEKPIQLQKLQFTHGDLDSINKKKEEINKQRQLQAVFDKYQKNKVKKIRISSVILRDGSKKIQSSFVLENLRFVGNAEGNPILVGGIYRYFAGQKIFYSHMTDDCGQDINTKMVYCKIKSSDICELSLDKYFKTSFYWKSGSMISLESFNGQKIAEFVFVGG
jgi:hypothetical protein